MSKHKPLPNDVNVATHTSAQPALGGDAKTLMFVNIAPTPAAAPETLCSLRFASKVHLHLVVCPACWAPSSCQSAIKIWVFAVIRQLAACSMQ